MFTLLNTAAKVTSRVDVSASTLALDTADLVNIPRPKPGSYGIPFEDDILMVEYGSAMSFRVKYCNLGLHKKVDVYHARESFPRLVLKEYFFENRDNPFALMYVIGRLAVRGDVTTPLTRVPPVVTSYNSPAARAQAVA